MPEKKTVTFDEMLEKVRGGSLVVGGAEHVNDLGAVLGGIDAVELSAVLVGTIELQKALYEAVMKLDRRLKVLEVVVGDQIG